MTVEVIREKLRSRKKKKRLRQDSNPCLPSTVEVRIFPGLSNYRNRISCGLLAKLFPFPQVKASIIYFIVTNLLYV